MTASRGFTLLELLVGLALLALLTTGLTPALRLAGQAWESVGRTADDAETMLTAQHFLRNAVTESYPLYFTEANGQRSLAYAGLPDALHMVTPMPAHLGLGGLQIVRISVAEHDGDRDLVVGWTPLLPASNSLDLDEDARRVVLASGVDKLELRYLGRDTISGPIEEFDSWIGHRGLPKLVSLRVTFRDGSAWPDLLARPMVDLGAMVTR